MCNVLHRHISINLQGFDETHLHHYGGHSSVWPLLGNKNVILNISTNGISLSKITPAGALTHLCTVCSTDKLLYLIGKGKLSCKKETKRGGGWGVNSNLNILDADFYPPGIADFPFILKISNMFLKNEGVEEGG